MGIAEEHAVTFAAGLASTGLHPFVAIYSSFLQRAYDQMLHDVCIQDLPVTFMVAAEEESFFSEHAYLAARRFT